MADDDVTRRGNGRGYSRPGAASRRAHTGGGRRSAGSRNSARRSVSATKRPAKTGRARPAATRPRGAPAGAPRRPAGPGQTVSASQRLTSTLLSPLARQIAALGIALCAVALSIAYPLRGYLHSQAAEAQAVEEQAQLADEIADLQDQQAALKDPNYIKAEAKRRLQYVQPGETVYVVKLPDTSSSLDADQASTDQAGVDNGSRNASADSDDATAEHGQGDDEPWYQSLWGTLSGDDTDGGR